MGPMGRSCNVCPHKGVPVYIGGNVDCKMPPTWWSKPAGR